jgi:hypothetical protein
MRLLRHKDKKPFEADYFDVLCGYVRWARGVDTGLDTKLINQFVLGTDSIAQYSNPRDVIEVARILDVELPYATLQMLPEPSDRDWSRPNDTPHRAGRSAKNLEERAINLARRTGRA